MHFSKIEFNVLIIAIVFSIIMYPSKIGKYENGVDKEMILADSSGPQLITPFYNSNHFVVADYVLSASSGDMYFSIQDTLNKCRNQGGGTVWLNRGIYKVSKTIIIPNNCTLMGDYQDPDNYQGTLEYGTKIVVDVNNFTADGDANTGGLFRLQPSSGVEGLTIYYKNQNINSPKAQPWSFIYDSGMLMSVKNITLINSYNGIGRSTATKTAHEMLMIENVKGTVLNIGVLVHNSSDVGTITNLTLTPKYLAHANLAAFGDNSSNPSESSIASSVKTRGGVGLMITDAEQSQFVNITISGFRFGIQIPNANLIQSRYMGSGSFYNLNISDCETGILADSGVYNKETLIDHRWGYVISNSSISGSNYAINNASSMVNNKRGTLKLSDVTIKGKVGGDAPVIYNNGGDAYKAVSKNVDLTGKVNNTGKYSNLNLYRKLKNNGTNFVSLNAGSSVQAINSALSSVASKGGGVVYLKPGIYRVDSSINVPANVELRGSASSSSRDFSSGTVINVVSNVRAIRLTGKYSGVYGINIIYENNVKMLARGSSYNGYDYSVFAENADNSYVKNVSIAGASHGIYFNKCNDFAIENVVTGAMDSAIRVDNSSGGLIMNCLQNGTVIVRNGLYSVDESVANFNYIMNPNTKKKLRYIYLNNDNNIEVQNCFTYGSYIFFTALTSTIYSVNTGYDGGTGNFYESTNSNGVVINALRMDGTMLKRSGGSIGAYNTAKIHNISEADVSANIIRISKKYIDGYMALSSTSASLGSSNKEISYRYDGDGKISCTSSNASFVKCSVDTSKKVLILTPVSNTNTPVSITISATRGVNYNMASAAISVTVNKSNGSNGDVDGNDKVEVNDYVLIRKHILKSPALTGDKLKRADVNGDGQVSAADYIAIRKIIINGGSSGGSTPQPVSRDTTPPTINAWSNTSLKNTTINASSATTTICNLGSDSDDGLKVIEYYTDCMQSKTASISNACATITISACKNATLYYRLKDNYNYSSLNSVNDIGKYLLYAQVYNKLLYKGDAASNNSSNLGYHVGSCSGSDASTCIINIGNVAVKQRASDSNQTFVEGLYQAILGRQADSGGLNGWVNDLNKGTSRYNALSGFVSSAEAKIIYAAWGYN